MTAEEDDDEDNVMAATVQELPSRSLDGLWERWAEPHPYEYRNLA